MLGLTPVFGDLAENDAAVSAVARQWRRLHELGVVATLDLVRAEIQSRA
jgi:hypothetical protein